MVTTPVNKKLEGSALQRTVSQCTITDKLARNLLETKNSRKYSSLKTPVSSPV